MHQQDESSNPNLKRWGITVKGTKFVARQERIVAAEKLHVNKFGDSLLMIGDECVATFKREMMVCAVILAQVRKSNKKDKAKEITANV
jgi:hypothetical protein